MLLEKSLLATVDTSKPYLSDGSESSVKTFVRECEAQKVRHCHFLLHYDFGTFSDPLIKLSLHHLSFEYLQTKGSHLANSFITFSKANITQTGIEKVINKTKGQYKSPLWRELRYGRITGSLVYEVSRCYTLRWVDN